MLVLSRKLSQQIRIGPDISIKVVAIDRDRVRLGIVAPDAVEIERPDAKVKTPRPGRVARTA